jgi:hypothetical protein
MVAMCDFMLDRSMCLTIVMSWLPTLVLVVVAASAAGPITAAPAATATTAPNFLIQESPFADRDRDRRLSILGASPEAD